MDPAQTLSALTARATELNLAADHAAALECAELALAIDPDAAHALFQRGLARAGTGNIELATADMESALYLSSDIAFGADTELYISSFSCHWDRYDQKVEILGRRIEDGHAVRPFHILNTPLSCRHQLKAAVAASADYAPPSTQPFARPTAPHDKIRLGYFSADFRDHAISHLLNGLFEAHDRSRFEVVGFSIRTWDDPVRKLMSQLVDKFVDVSELADDEISRLAREMEIDIALDINVHTDRQPSFFALRVAPIQVNYLGCPGTSGAACYDYIIGDKFVAPPEHAGCFTERIVTMPHCYQVNSLRRYAKFKSFTRADLGLPESGFVFCSFNTANKISPHVFDIWMRLLTAVEGSVLWLFTADPTAERNLRREAKERGVSPARIIFAPRMPLAEHLARHRCADLFLDTFYYGAHTTGSDALWAGLPIVTCLGTAFAGRVTASLLDAVGLPELIASDYAAYESLALRLARSPEVLRAYRKHLDETKMQCPLFDTLRYTRYIERAFEQMWMRYRSGLPPKEFAVADLR